MTIVIDLIAHTESIQVVVLNIQIKKHFLGLVRNSGRVPKTAPTRVPEPAREDRKPGHQSRRVSDPARQAVLSRLTKSRSSTREAQLKPLEKGWFSFEQIL